MMKIILANTLSEGNAYAREQGFRHGQFRVASRAAAIRGLREAEVHELPSFANRIDKHSIRAALRWNRGPHFIVEDEWTWPKIKVGPAEPELPFDTSTTTSSEGAAEPVTTPEPEPVVVEKARVSTRPAPVKKSSKRVDAAMKRMSQIDVPGDLARLASEDF